MLGWGVGSSPWEKGCVIHARGEDRGLLADHHIVLLIAGTQVDQTSQPPWHCGMAMRQSSSL